MDDVLTADSYTPCECDLYGERSYCTCKGLEALGWAPPSDIATEMLGRFWMAEIPAMQVRRGGVRYPSPHMNIQIRRTGWRKWALVGVFEKDGRQIQWGTYKSKKEARKMRGIFYTATFTLYNVWR